MQMTENGTVMCCSYLSEEFFKLEIYYYIFKRTVEKNSRQIAAIVAAILYFLRYFSETKESQSYRFPEENAV